MIEVIIKIVVPVVAMLSLAFNVVQYFRNKKINKLDAERELAKREIERGRLEAKHRQERRDLLADCDGEIRERDNVSVNTLTTEDNRRLTELHEEQQWEWNELMAEMTYFQRILGQNPGLLVGEETILDKVKWKMKSFWRKIKNEI